jgi:hypothetical protein
MKFQHRNQHIRGIRIERKNDSTFLTLKQSINKIRILVIVPVNENEQR